MTEERFWGMLALDDSPVFDYGRDVLKELTMERWINEQGLLPYKRYPLFGEGDWYKSGQMNNIVQVAGLLRSGFSTGASLKAGIKIRTH